MHLLNPIKLTSIILLLIGSAWAANLPPEPDVQADVALRRDFAIFNPHYEQDRALREARLRTLSASMYADEAKGIKNVCGHQVLEEAGALMITRADFALVDRRLRDLAALLSHSSSDVENAQGMWGNCYEGWALKLNATFDHLEDSAANEPAPHPFPAFLARVSTPQKVISYLDTVAVSDVRHTGIDHGREFNDATSVLVRMIIRGEPENYVVPPELRAALLDNLMRRYRNRVTGFWGERYVRGEKEDFVDDLSTTFHIVSYLKGQVPDMPLLIQTLLSLKDQNYPSGWLWNGALWNHNNMDVVTLFEYGWSTADRAQRDAMRTEIERMLHWCLTDSLQADGSFRSNIADSSLEQGEYYGVSFLERIGFLNSRRRFWTDRNFPEADEVKARIRHFIEAHKSGDALGDRYKSVLTALGPSS